jgi:anthranilate phosphoribosyltransferase
MKAGIEQARAAIESGAAKAKLEQLVSITKSLAG